MTSLVVVEQKNCSPRGFGRGSLKGLLWSSRDDKRHGSRLHVTPYSLSLSIAASCYRYCPHHRPMTKNLFPMTKNLSACDSSYTTNCRRNMGCCQGFVRSSCDGNNTYPALHSARPGENSKIRTPCRAHVP